VERRTGIGEWGAEIFEEKLTIIGGLGCKRICHYFQKYTEGCGKNG